MKRLTTVICCLALMVFGAFIAYNPNIGIQMPGNQTALAQVVPPTDFIGKLPLDVQLDLDKRLKKDTVVIRDTVQSITTKYVKVRKPARTTVMHVPMPLPGPMSCIPVNNKYPGAREENTPVDTPDSKSSEIILTVDGQIVYSTKDDNHSAEKGQ